MKLVTFIVLFVLAEGSSGTGNYSLPSDIYELILFQLKRGSSADCRRHVHELIFNLKDHTPWAVKMYDSGGKFPRGVITRNTFHAGNYYDCVDIKTTDGTGIPFQGQYCVVPIYIHERKSTTPDCDTDDCSAKDKKHQNFNISAKEKALRNYVSDKIHWTICIPSTCTYSEIKEAMNDTIAYLGAKNGLTTELSMTAVDCATQQMKIKTSYEDIFTFSMSCLCFICLASTVYDCFILPGRNNHGESPGRLVSILLGFSMRISYEELMKEPSKSDGLRPLYGIRVISSIFIIAFHRMFFTTFAPLQNPDFYLLLKNKFPLMLFRSGEMAVDTFFTMSAFLHVHSLLQHHGKFPFLKHIVKRYMRLTPVAALVILANVILVNNMMHYPLWKYLVFLLQRPCLATWRSNLLYVSNYEICDEMSHNGENWYVAMLNFDGEETFAQHALLDEATKRWDVVSNWIKHDIGADMQLYTASAPLIIMVIKYPSVALPIFATLALLSIAIPFAVTLSTGISPVLLTIIDINIHPLVREHAEKLYLPTHSRAGPYVIGLIAGFLYHQMQQHKWKFSKILSWSSMVFNLICCLGPLYYSTKFYNPNNSYSAIDAAVFASTNRMLWAIGICVMILDVGSRTEGLLYQFLGHKIFVPLGKLTYSALLANILINVYFLGSTQQPISLSIIYFMTNTVSDVFYTFLMGIFIFFIVEQPFRIQSELLWNGFKMKSIHGCKVAVGKKE